MLRRYTHLRAEDLVHGLDAVDSSGAANADTPYRGLEAQIAEIRR